MNHKPHPKNFKRYPKYGYKFDEDMLPIPDDHEQHILCIIHDLWENGLSLAKIAQHLNSQGYRTRQNNEFKANWMQRLAKQHQPRYEYYEAYKAKKNK